MHNKLPIDEETLDSIEEHTTINGNASLSERVIRDLLEQNKIAEVDLSITATQLQTNLSIAESIGAEHISLDDIDIVVVLSGRSGFTGTYLEASDKHVLCPDAFDSSDTLRRMLYGINIAKQGSKRNKEQGKNKPVYIYFNGVKRQNDELENILKTEGSFDGYPASLFIVDPIPFDNTMGQVVAFSKYLHEHWSLFCCQWGLTRPPNVVACTGSFHKLRVELSIGSNSPLLSPDFWHSHPELLKALSGEMKDYVLSPGNTLKNAAIAVLGCERQISAYPFWEKDAYGDMQAVLNYSTISRLMGFDVQPVPLIANEKAPNTVTLSKVKPGRRLRSNGLRIFDVKESSLENGPVSNDSKNHQEKHGSSPR
ncbi:MAG: hypothetical protein NXI01_00850 [Gammaproteobacteria bacterium]|nr:hypothetical protein [Gammaproteobacteria bacterium]